MLSILIASVALAAEPCRGAPSPELSAFLELEIAGAPGARRRAQDAALQRQLDAMTSALARIEARATDPASLCELALAAGHLADRLVASPPPSYLTPEQVEMYRMALEDRAWELRGRQGAALERIVAGAGPCAEPALDAARMLAAEALPGWRALAELPPMTRGDCVLARTDPRMAPLALLASGDVTGAAALLAEPTLAHPAAREHPQVALAARIVAAYEEDRRRVALPPRPRPERSPPELLARLRERRDALQEALDACAPRLNPGTLEEVGIVLEQAGLVLDGAEAHLATDARALVDAYVSALDERCAGR